MRAQELHKGNLASEVEGDDQTIIAARNLGATTVLYRLDCTDDEAWRRIAARNMASHRSLHVARETFEAIRARVEPLGDDEAFVIPAAP